MAARKGSECNCTTLRKASRRISQLYDTALTIRLVDSGGRGIERTARDLGISKSSLTRWMSERRETDLLCGPHDDMQKELARLRRENELLRAERDLLKKAAAFFARETSR